MIKHCGIIALILLSGIAQAQKNQKQRDDVDLVLFTIRDWPVYQEEFNYLYRKNHNNPGDFSEEKINEYLNLLINFKLKVAEARNRGLDTTRAFVKEFNTYKEELKKPYRAEGDELDRLTKEAYERMKLEIKAAHILISLKPDAPPVDTLAAYNKIAAIRQRALAGEDFEKLAKEASDDPSAKVNGGNLGYFTTLQMVYPFEEEAYRTDKGGISRVVRSRFGYHLIKVIDRRPSQGEVEVSHILLRAAKGNEKITRNTIFEIYDQLKGGRKWDELCKEYSEDANTKNTGGRLKPFGVGVMSSVPEFENAAFALKSPGDISDPFQSSYGWHIVRLEKKIPLQPFREMETSLRRRVSRDERLAFSKAASLEKRKVSLGFSEESALKITLFSFADSSLVKGRWHYAGPDTLAEKTLVIMGTDKSKARDFLSYVSVHATRSNLAPASYMKQLYDRFVEEKVDDEEEKKLLNEKPEYRLLLNEYREGILLFEVMEKEVWNKASQDSAGQLKYYVDHPDKFQAGNRVEARILAAADKTVLQEIKGKIVAGDTLREADLKKLKSVTNWKVYERSESQVIDQINWVPGLQEAQSKGTFYLVEVSRLVAPGRKTFEEARAGIISGYQDMLEKEWLNHLRQNYPVKINKKAKAAVIAGLRK